MNKSMMIQAERLKNCKEELQIMTTCRDHWKTSYETVIKAYKEACKELAFRIEACNCCPIQQADVDGQCSYSLKENCHESIQNFYLDKSAAKKDNLETNNMREPETIVCGWCNKGYRFEFNWIDDDGNTITTKDNMVIGDVADYCPVCGRKLEKESES